MTKVRPFRFGVMVESVHTRDHLIQTARTAEATGYDILLVRDHWLEEPFGHQLAPLVSLAVVAEATSHLRIGTMVIANDYRHPVILAKEAATLDLLSRGRFELGLGAGFHRAEYEAAGMIFEPPGARVERLEEAIPLLKRLFTGQPTTVHGNHYRVTDLEIFPRPVQRPHPSFLIAGAGKRMLSLAGREADIVGLQTVSTGGGALGAEPTERLAESVERKLGLVREAAGARFAEIELSLFPTFVFTEDRPAAARRHAQERGWAGLPNDEILAMPALFVGTADEIATEMIARRRRYGVSYFVISDRDMAAVAPIVERLAGC